MNELIEELHNNLIKARFPLGTISIDDMRIIVDTACKAQRNACAREYLAHDRTELNFNTVEYVNGLVRNERTVGAIMMSKIERQDYE